MHNVFYIGYNSSTQEVLPDTMYRHESDTNVAMERFVGVNWKDKGYLSVKKCKVVIDEPES